MKFIKKVLKISGNIIVFPFYLVFCFIIFLLIKYDKIDFKW